MNAYNHILSNCSAQPSPELVLDPFLIDPAFLMHEPIINHSLSEGFISISTSFSVAEAIESIRMRAGSSLYECYLIDNSRVLCGRVALHSLLMADGSQSVRQLASSDYPVLTEGGSKELAATLMREQALFSLPIVNDQHQLVGVFTYLEGMSAVIKEDQEDIERMMGISGEGNVVSYRELSIGQHIKNRVGWLVALALLGFVSGSILLHYESALDQLVILAIYLPMIADTGGNAGSQSASIITRALALGELTLKDTWRIIRREFTISLGLAAILAMVAMTRIWFFTAAYHLPGDLSIELVMLCISMALAIQVITSTLIGAVLPLIVSYFKQDPAVVASPAITTLVDISGLLIYFYLVSRFLLN